MSEEFHEGDRVVAVAGETTITGKLWGCEELFVGVSRRTVKSLLDDSFAVTVTEKAAPPLPTEPGLYVRGDIPLAHAAVYVLSADGDWYRQDRKGTPETTLEVVRELHARGDFPRLEPVPVTAKGVLDALRGRIGSIDSAYDFQSVAAEFGVTTK